MSRGLLGGMAGVAELQRVVDEPLDLLAIEPALEGRHRAVAFGDALADGGAVAAQRHGRGEEVGPRVQGERAGVSFPPVAVAAGAVGLIELGRREVLPGAAGDPRGHGDPRDYGEEAERKQLQGLRWTIVAVAWSRGRTTISSMLTWDGRVAAQTTQSATSPGVRGSRPR